MGTNKLGESFTNSNNTLSALVSLGFASGTKYTLSIIATLAFLPFVTVSIYLLIFFSFFYITYLVPEAKPRDTNILP